MNEKKLAEEILQTVIKLNKEKRYKEAQAYLLNLKKKYGKSSNDNK